MKKRSQERTTRKKFKIAISPVVVVGLLTACAVAWYGWWTVNNAACFRVRYVITRGGDPVALMHIRGRNIFRVNLDKEAELLLQTYPDYHNVQMVRVLPNRIFVNLIKRRPLALIKLYKMFAIDEEGVLFGVRPEYADMGLAVITGLETKIFGPKPGRRYVTKELSSALEMISLVKKNPLLQAYSVSSVDVAVASQASLELVPTSHRAQGIEVRMGVDHISRKISLLAGLLRQQSSQDIDRIAYIDLRFKEPVIKLKDEKKKEGAS
jgi:cell division septal protein FtsQ